jgi:hypothetical protein
VIVRNFEALLARYSLVSFAELKMSLPVKVVCFVRIMKLLLESISLKFAGLWITMYSVSNDGVSLFFHLEHISV